MIEIATDPVGLRLHLAPYDNWASEFHVNGRRWEVDALYYRDGVEARQRYSARHSRSTTRVSLVLPIDELADADGTDEVTVKHPALDGEQGWIREPYALSRLPSLFARLLSEADPDRTFEATSLPPVRSADAHAIVRNQYPSRRAHARAAVDRMSPPVEALVPLETSHRVLAVEPIERVRERGDPTDATVWAQYHNQLLPGECLGVHLTKAQDAELQQLREHGFDRQQADTPPDGVADDIRWNVLHAWIHAPDIGRWGGLRNCHAVVVALPKAFTFVGQYAIPDEAETYETHHVVRFPEYAAELAIRPDALADSHTPDTLLYEPKR